MDSCDGNGQHHMGGYTETSVLFMWADSGRRLFPARLHKKRIRPKEFGKNII